MRGSIKQRSPGVWSLIYDVPPPEGVTRKQQRETFYGNKKAAEKRLNELVGSVQKGTYIPPSVLTTGDYCRKWLEGSVKNTVAPTTLERYERIVRLHITPGIGSIPLSALHPQQVQDWYNGLDYKPNTVKCIHTVLHRALSQAVRLKAITSNPSDGIELPRCNPSKKTVLCEDDILAIIEAARGGQYYLSIVLLAYTGMRAGEVCGLRWEDVDLTAGTVSVKRTAALLNNRIIYKAPKTRNSIRTIVLPQIALDALHDDQSIREGLICPYRPANLHNRLSRLAKRIGIKATPHSLRHAHASLLDRAGESVKVISERLGHGSIQTTLETYTHTIPGQHRDAARKVDAAFSRQSVTLS